VSSRRLPLQIKGGNAKDVLSPIEGEEVGKDYLYLDSSSRAA